MSTNQTLFVPMPEGRTRLTYIPPAVLLPELIERVRASGFGGSAEIGRCVLLWLEECVTRNAWVAIARDAMRDLVNGWSRACWWHFADPGDDGGRSIWFEVSNGVMTPLPQLLLDLLAL